MAGFPTVTSTRQGGDGHQQGLAKPAAVDGPQALPGDVAIPRLHSAQNPG